jgi:subtilisin
MRARMLLAVLGLVVLTPGVANASTSRYVVVYKPGVADVNAETNNLEARYGFSSTLRYAHALKGFAASLASPQLSSLTSNPDVAYVAPDITFAATGLVSLAAGETEPVGIKRIGAATATQVHASSGANVAVLDTGIDLANSDINAASGTNCIKSGASAQDDNGHGTNVAGIIAAKDQGAGVVGVAPGTKLYAVKVLNSKGTGTLSQILCGINWITANSAALNIKVVNMSLAGAGANDNNCGNTNKDAEHQAICHAVAAGVTIVAAAGNNAATFANYVPAAYPEVLTVTAMTDTDGLAGALGPTPCISKQKDDMYATYSNFGASVTDQAHTIAAPGTCVLSDGLGGGISDYYGTSQAAPHVAGAVALCLNDAGVQGPCSGLTTTQIITKVRADSAAVATPITGFTGDPLHAITGKYFGYLIDASRY